MRKQGENPRPGDLTGGAQLSNKVCQIHGVHITI